MNKILGFVSIRISIYVRSASDVLLTHNTTAAGIRIP